MASGWVRARAPATIANVGPGFDVFAMAVRGPSDKVAIRFADRDSLRVHGVEATRIPSTFSDNTAGIVIDALRAMTGITQALEVRVGKGIPPERGLGSSAGSCVAAALAFLKAFPKSRDLEVAEVLQAAVEGEAAVSGRHYDNVAAALLGGFITLASTEPLLLSRESVSARIVLAIAIPDFPLRTAEMREILPDRISLRDAVSNVGRAATLALALARGDAVLAGRCLEDRFAEPARARFLTAYANARPPALKGGAAGFGICGSGSSVFAIAPDPTVAAVVALAMGAAFPPRGPGVVPFGVATIRNSCMGSRPSIRSSSAVPFIVWRASLYATSLGRPDLAPPSIIEWASAAMNPGPLPLRPVTASSIRSSTLVTRPIAPKISSRVTASCSVAVLPSAKAVAPSPTAHARFGMIRTTRPRPPNNRSMNEVRTPAASVMISTSFRT